MKAKSIKLIIVLAVVLLVVTGLSIRAFWPTERTDVRSLQVNKSDSAEKAKLTARAKHQEQTAGPYIHPEYARIVAYCQETIKQYPGTEKAEKARQLLSQVPQRYRGADSQLASHRKPEIKRSRPLRRRRMMRNTMDVRFDETAVQQ